MANDANNDKRRSRATPVRCTDDTFCDGLYRIYPRTYPTVSVAHHCDRGPTTVLGDFPSVKSATEFLGDTDRLRTFTEI